MHSHELFSVCGVLRYLWYLSAVIFTFEDWDNGGGCKLNGRTIPSFRIALAMEKEEWKSFRNALDKSDRKKFDEMMFDIPRFYISACSNSVQYVKLHSILMFKLLYNYRELTECTSEVEQIEAKVERLLLLKKEKGGGEEERQHYRKLKLLL
jgi:hypothetical protein